MPFFFLLFILVPIVEIGVFIQVGDRLGLAATLIIVFATAVMGVSLLKQQGLKTLSDIQLKIAQGQIPAVEMVSAAQLLFAGGLLLTPGFVTDMLGFLLMLPLIRFRVAGLLLRYWYGKSAHFSQSNHFDVGTQADQANTHKSPGYSASTEQRSSPRTIEGEFEDHSEK